MNNNSQKRKPGGLYPQKKGADFESRIQKICNYYRQQKIAWINKKATAIRMLPEDEFGKRKIIHAEKSTVDFEGFLKTGRHIAFDVKSTKNLNEWTYGNNKKVHKQAHQIQYLYDAWKNGCIAFILIKARDNRIIKVFPDESWNNVPAVKIIFSEHIIIHPADIDDFLLIE